MSNYLLIKQGTIHNAIEKEPFVADILVENGKIKKIAPVLEGKIINDADVIDATGIDVYPGFVDAHCHMGLDLSLIHIYSGHCTIPAKPVSH